MGADGDNLMAFEPFSRIEQQDSKRLTFRVVIGILGHMQPPVGGRVFGCIAELLVLRRGTFPQGLDFILVRLSREFEWFDELFNVGKGGRLCVHVVSPVSGSWPNGCRNGCVGRRRRVRHNRHHRDAATSGACGSNGSQAVKVAR